MNDEQQKAWDELVKILNERDRFVDIRFLPADYSAILAADAELKRLREAVEWACKTIGNATMISRDAVVAEIRRRAKEG